MKLSNEQEMSWKCRMWYNVWEKGQPKLFDMHAMGGLVLQHAGWLQVSYILLYFNHSLLTTRFAFSFYSKHVSSLPICNGTAGSVSSLYLLFSSFHASCLMVPLYLWDDIFLDHPPCICHSLLCYFRPFTCREITLLGSKHRSTWNCNVTVSSIITLFCRCLQRHIAINFNLTEGLQFPLPSTLSYCRCATVVVSSLTLLICQS